MELKELLKPPFRVEGDFIVNDDVTLLKYNNYTRAEYSTEVMKFAAEALNEKWKRDFGEPLRWIRKAANQYECPECGLMQHFEYKHCHNCGAELKSPEEVNDGDE